MCVMLAEKLADGLELSGLFGTAKAWGKPPRGSAEMAANNELLMRSKIEPQRPCHLRHKAGKVPLIHSNRKVSESGSRDLSSALVGERGRVPACLYTRETQCHTTP